jgi:hypothetical protein
VLKGDPARDRLVCYAFFRSVFQEAAMFRTGLFMLTMFPLLFPTAAATDPQLPAVSLGAKVATVKKPTHGTPATGAAGCLLPNRKAAS